MSGKVLIGQEKLQVMILRLCHQLLEATGKLDDVVLMGLQPRGTPMARRMAEVLTKLTGNEPQLGWIDVTFHRDDFRRRDAPLQPNATHIPFVIEGKKVILIDDVLFTGRTVRAALEAMTAYGRPASVELVVLVNRHYARELPIEAQYIGTSINSTLNERVRVNWAGNGADRDEVWLWTPEN